jgi:hypothetical protein
MASKITDKYTDDSTIHDQQKQIRECPVAGFSHGSCEVGLYRVQKVMRKLPKKQPRLYYTIIHDIFTAL